MFLAQPAPWSTKSHGLSADSFHSLQGRCAASSWPNKLGMFWWQWLGSALLASQWVNWPDVMPM